MKKVIIVISIFCILGCNDKKMIVPVKLNLKTSEKFDLKKFNDNKKDSVYEYYPNDTIIKLHEEKDHYKKEVRFEKGSFNYIFLYNKTTNLLISEFSSFYGMPIGIWTNYDENGNLIEWKNHDEGFSFTVNDLIVMLKKDLQIDLINDEYYRSLVISRHFDKKFYLIDSYFYLIEISDAGGTRTIKIDGETGKILTDESSFIEE